MDAKALVEQMNRRAAKHFEAAKEWKAKTGRRVIAHLLPDIPEEIIHACGFLPLPVFSLGHQFLQSRGHLPDFSCPLIRNPMELALDGQLDFTDGMVIPYVCDSTRAFSQIWESIFPEKFNHSVWLPKKQEGDAVESFLCAEFTRLKDDLRILANREVTDDDLKHSIQLFNTNRRLLRELFHFMAQGTLPLDYPEFMLLLKASMLMPKEEANISLRAIRENLFKTSRPNSRDEKRIKVFLYGAILEDASILKSLENSRMGVSMDNLYNGTRYFLHDVDETIDPIRALVQRHFRKDPLSVYHYSKDRLRNYFDSVITTNQIDAFIFLAPMYCEPMEFDFPFVKELAEKSGVPVLFLETDFSSSNAQLFTKLEAFLEMLGGY